MLTVGVSCHPVGVRGDLAAVLGEHPADRLDPEAVSVLVDVGDYLGWLAVELRPEESRCGLENFVGPPQLFHLALELAELGSLVGREPGRVPTSISARRTQIRSVSWLIPSFAEIDSIAFHCEGYSSRARRPSAPLARGPPLGRAYWTPCSSLPLLHPLKGWSSHQSRGDSLQRKSVVCLSKSGVPEDADERSWIRDSDGK